MKKSSIKDVKNFIKKNIFLLALLLIGAMLVSLGILSYRNATIAETRAIDQPIQTIENEKAFKGEDVTLNEGSKGKDQVKLIKYFIFGINYKTETVDRKVLVVPVPKKISTGILEKEYINTTESVPFETKEILDPLLNAGTRVTVQFGVNGTKNITYEVIKLRGTEISRKISYEAIVKPQTPQTVRVGTYVYKPQYRTGAVCNDGWVSSATGSGACSWHGGVSYWLYN
jgi:uncharacterized protein YabE (DUF348 family)